MGDKEELREKSKIEKTKEVANNEKTERTEKNKKRKFRKRQGKINYKIVKKTRRKQSKNYFYF